MILSNKQVIKVLLITNRDPYPPRTGAKLYAAGLIESLSARPEISLTVYSGEGLNKINIRPHGVTWIGGQRKSPIVQDIRSIFSKSPRALHRATNLADQKNLSDLCKRERFDAILMNEISIASVVEGLSEGSPPLIYIAHNSDGIVRPQVATGAQSIFLRSIQMWDARKFAAIEKRVVSRCSAITAITEEDRKYFLDFPNAPQVTLLKPGYCGPKLLEPRSFPEPPGRALLIGSFGWRAKVDNLRELLECHKRNNPKFVLRVAGNFQSGAVAKLSSNYPKVEFIPNFDDLKEVMSECSVAFILERLGGGFKLKILDYAFQRIPIIAFPQAMTGSELEAGKDYISVEDFNQGIQAATSLSINESRMRQISESAFAKVSGRYEWSDRAGTILQLLQKVSVES